jgi:peptidoglycan hydrolase CwlO-like protein
MPVKTSATIKASQWMYDKIFETQHKTGLTQHEALDLIVKELMNTNVSLNEQNTKLLEENKKMQSEIENLKKTIDDKNSELSKCLKALKG